jgi:3',5'-cyclic AMP phosphodiesterase CpdA
MFSLIHLPDTQFYCRDNPAIFAAQTRWILDHIASHNIAFVSHTGDVVDDANSDSQYAAARAAMDPLDGVVPYAVLPGNHDRYNEAKYRANFGASRYSWYGGYTTDQLSSWQTFTADTVGFLHLALAFQPDQPTLDWALSVLAAHPDHRVILSTHAFLHAGHAAQGYPDGSRTAYVASPDYLGGNGQAIWDQLIYPRDQVFLVLCGHNHGVWTRSDANSAGHPVVQMLADYQAEADGGGGFMRLITIPT